MTLETTHADEPPGTQRTAGDYVRLLARRKWAILLPLVLLPLLTVLLALRQEPLYEASANVLLGGDNVATQLLGIEDARARVPDDRVAETEARLARVPAVVTRALEQADQQIDVSSRAALLAASSVTSVRNTDILGFSVSHRDPRLAIALANAYAGAYVAYRAELDTAAVARARRDVQRRVAEIEAAGDRRSELYRTLVENEQRLATLEAFQMSNAFVVQEAERAAQVQPRPVRNGVLGVVLGLILGVAFAILWEALDTRVRTVEEVGQRLGLPLLARLPEPSRRLRKDGRLVMLAFPSAPEAEPYRMLRTNVEFANLERGAKTIMITSAVPGEGKSTTIANLAIAFARAGRRVILVDLDLRKPIVSSFFHLDGRPGATDVALGVTDVGRALATIALANVQPKHQTRDVNGRTEASGELQVLTAGTMPPNPGEFLETGAFASVLAQLRARGDIVLIDAPPLLHIGDSLTLSAKVDALFLVVRHNILKRPLLNELRRVLDVAPAAKLGFCLTGVETADEYGYGSYYGRQYVESP